MCACVDTRVRGRVRMRVYVHMHVLDRVRVRLFTPAHVCACARARMGVGGRLCSPTWYIRRVDVREISPSPLAPIQPHCQARDTCGHGGREFDKAPTALEH